MNATAKEALSEIEREIRMREGVYPKWVEAGRLSRPAADRQIVRMKAARDIVAKAAELEENQGRLL